MTPKSTHGGMAKAELRSIALRAARSYLREQGIDPAQVDAEAALAALDDLCRIDEDTLASLWYGQASDNQIRQFRREWGQWRLEELKRLSSITLIDNLVTGKRHLMDEDGRPLCGASLPRLLWEVNVYHVANSILSSNWMCKKCLAKL